jgi:hypothetical protein
MKTRSFVAAIAVLGLSAFAFTAGDAFATKIVEIKGKYSKIKLDGICAANGGSSYGSAEGSYGCTKGNVSVECHNDGSCKGYVDLVASPGGSRVWSSPEAVLQQSETPAKRGTTTGATGGTLTSQ